MVTQRNIVTCILLTFVTCGIYGIYWFICLTNEVNYVSGSQGTSGGKAVLFTLVTCGIYHYYWGYKQGEKLDAARAQRGMMTSGLNILYLLLCIFGLGIVAYALMQNELNQFVN